MEEARQADEKKTPLYDIHVSSGGKIVPFGGYLLPVQYSGVIAEHMAVRTAAALFDVSHMGEVLYTGYDALANLEKVFTNSLSGMKDGGVRYSPMCNESGGVIDDVLIYRYGPEKYLAVVNASNRDKDFAWMKKHAFGDVMIEDISDGIAQVALQGPKSLEILERVAAPGDIPGKYYTFVDGASVGGVKCLLSRTGYTGELGYELYSDSSDAISLWKALIGAGLDLGIIPAGLGARDTLRLEAGMPLYGHEMDETVSPFEAGLDFAVSMSKADFIGRGALEKGFPPKRVRVGLKMIGRGIARAGEGVFMGDDEIGRTTSGTHCPFLKYPAAMALVDAKHSRIGSKVEIDVRGRRVEAEIAALPFYSNAK
jgi:aminomethyltransferase